MKRKCYWIESSLKFLQKQHLCWRGDTIPRKKKTEKKKSISIYLVVAVIAIIIILAVIAFNLNTSSEIQNIGNEIPTSANPGTVQTGGFCKIDSECFITSCKGQTESCVNTTQLTFYSRNCNTYSDWIIGKQDVSRCSCIQNACIMR